MNISPLYNKIYFHSSYIKDKKETKNYCHKQFIKYGTLGTLGAIGGYMIPLKQIDGDDIISHVNASKKLVMMKTKVSNTKGKLINAGIGLIVGVLCVKLYEKFKDFQ